MSFSKYFTSIDEPIKIRSRISSEQLSDAEPLLKVENTSYTPILRSTATTTRSYYYDKFPTGASFIPRPFWFVRVKIDNPLLSYDPIRPWVESDENRNTTERWKKIKLEGNVEKKFIYTTILAQDLIPFGYLRRRLIVVPGILNGNRIQLFSSASQTELFMLEFSKYLQKAEELWQEYGSQKSKQKSIYQRINYCHYLTNQNPYSKFKVLYVASATYMTSCVIKPNETYYEKVIGSNGNNDLDITGFFADVTTHCYDTDNEGEAHYLCGILNSKTLDDLIKPFQAKGSFGERHIQKLPLSFPIPKYDPNILSHKELAEDGLTCDKKVKSLIVSLQSIKSIGRIRSIIRRELTSEYRRIDDNVKAILSQSH